MAIQTWVVEIYDDGATEPKWESHTLDFEATVEVVEKSLQRGTGETVKVKTPLNATDRELGILRDLGALLFLPPE
jgi:hypothetical protein